MFIKYGAERKIINNNHVDFDGIMYILGEQRFKSVCVYLFRSIWSVYICEFVCVCVCVVINTQQLCTLSFSAKSINRIRR